MPAVPARAVGLWSAVVFLADQSDYSDLNIRRMYSRSGILVWWFWCGACWWIRWRLCGSRLNRLTVTQVKHTQLGQLVGWCQCLHALVPDSVPNLLNSCLLRYSYCSFGNYFASSHFIPVPVMLLLSKQNCYKLGQSMSPIILASELWILHCPKLPALYSGSGSWS